MSPVADLANPPHVDTEMFGEVRRESGMNHRNIVGQPDGRRFHDTHRTRREARHRSCFRDPAAVQIVNQDPDCGSPPGQTGANGRHRGGQ